MAERGTASEHGGTREENHLAAIASSLGRSPASNEVITEAAAFLRDQRKLVNLQTENLEEDRALQHRHLALRYFGDRLRIGLQVLAITFGLVLAVGSAAILWQAHEDHGLVVEAFSVPPDLAQRGLTGQVVAKLVLDRLADLQGQTLSMRAYSSYQNNWGEDLKVEIPQTGVSLGELRRYIWDWLGHETHISGEVYRTAAGLTVTARAGPQAAESFTGPDADLDTLIQRAALAVFARTQPSRYGSYLLRQNRFPEALVVFSQLAHSPDALERAWAHFGLGGEQRLTGNLVGGIQEMRLASRQVPGFAPALFNIADWEKLLGHDQQAARDFSAFLNDPSSTRRYIAPGRQQETLLAARARLASLLGDYVQEALSARAMLALPDPADGPYFLVEAVQMNHELSAARTLANALPPPANGGRLHCLGAAALDDGDPASVALLTQDRDLDAAGTPAPSVVRDDAAWLAIAEARFGDVAGARALIASTPLDCYLCVRTRAIVAAAGGDRPAADRWFAEAIHQGPDLPQAYADRGKARLAWGDVAGALADAEHANRLSPHYPDALKLWGDALVRQGRWRDALARYDAGLEVAPAWTALRRARDLARRKS